jgi:hypothetical protein
VLTIVVGIGAFLAGLAAGWIFRGGARHSSVSQREVPPAAHEASVARPIPAAVPLPAPESFVLEAEVISGSRELLRVLCGIAEDEGGRVGVPEGSHVSAVFADAVAAVEAAQRMASNVDALARRIRREMTIAIGIGDSPASASRLEGLAREAGVAVAFDAAVARHSGNAVPLGDGFTLESAAAAIQLELIGVR